MTTTTDRKPNATERGYPLLPAQPFLDWIHHNVHLCVSDIAARMGVDEAVVRRWWQKERVSEAHVELLGLALIGEPRLAAQLYPELDY